MIVSAGMAAQMQAKSLFRGFKIPSARNYWACCALKRTATSANVWDNSPFEMRFGTVPQSQIPFLKPGYVKTKYQDTLRPKLRRFNFFSVDIQQTAPVIPMRCFPIQDMFILAPSHGRGYLLQSLFLQRMCVLCVFQGWEENLIQVAMEWWKKMRMWSVVKQASSPASDRESLHAWLLRILRLSHLRISLAMRVSNRKESFLNT